MSEEHNNLSTTSPLRTRRKPIPLSAEQRRIKQQVFLDAYAECGVIKYAAQVAGVNRATVRWWREHDKEFQAAFPDAKEDAIESLEIAAYQQAVEGAEEYVVSGGKVMFGSDGKPLMNRRYSPQLLIALLKANLPEKYKDKREVEHSGAIDISNARESLLLKLQGMAQQESKQE